MLRDAIGHAESDATARMLREAEVEARQLLDAVERALQQDGRLLLPKEQFSILRAMQDVADALEQCAEGEGTDAAEHKALREQLRRSSEGLNQATTAFAGRRMDACVRGAFTGQRIDALDVAEPAAAALSASPALA